MDGHKVRLARLLRIRSKIVGQMLESSFQDVYIKKMLSPAGKIMSDPSHILYEEYQLLQSNRRLRVAYARMNRLQKVLFTSLSKYLISVTASYVYTVCIYVLLLVLMVHCIDVVVKCIVYWCETVNAVGCKAIF